MILSHPNLDEQVNANASGEDGVPPITSVCTFTRNRTKTLQRFLTSYGQSIRKHGREIRLIVADQSDERSTRQDNFEILQKIRNEFGIPCFYAAHDEKEQFAVQLARTSDIDPSLVRFALCHDVNGPAPYGANRNALLLSTVDELTIQAGDDTVCGVISAEEAWQPLVLTSELNPQEIVHFTEQEQASYENLPERDDVFSLHERVLGKSLNSCIQQNSSQKSAANLDRCKLSFWRKLEPRSVAVTCTGLIGDSNMGTPYFALLSQGKTRESLLQSEEKYRFCLSRQLLLRCARHLTIAERGWKGAPCEGLDNRQLLPPFSPIQRGEDVIFGMLLEFSSSGYLGYLPWMVRHNRASSHSFRIEDVIEFATRSCSYTIMKMLLEDLQFSNRSDPAKNLAQVGRSLEEWGSLPRRDFEEAICQKLLGRWLKQIELMEERLHSYDAQPRFWADDLTRCLDALKAAVRRPAIVPGADFAGPDGKGDCPGMLQTLITRFGALLQVWTELRHASRELHKRGIQLARPV